MYRYICLIAFLIFLIPAASYSGSTKEDFYNNDLLNQAVIDIQKMPREELDSFISFLASCGATYGGQIQKFFCQRDSELYLNKYESGRSIDRVINALIDTWLWMEATNKASERNSKRKIEILKALDRYVIIMRKLKDSANKHFQQLLIIPSPPWGRGPG